MPNRPVGARAATRRWSAVDDDGPSGSAAGPTATPHPLQEAHGRPAGERELDGGPCARPGTLAALQQPVRGGTDQGEIGQQPDLGETAGKAVSNESHSDNATAGGPPGVGGSASHSG